MIGEASPSPTPTTSTTTTQETTIVNNLFINNLNKNKIKKNGHHDDNDDGIIPFIGYTDRLSARPGETIRFYVSCKFANDVATTTTTTTTNDDDNVGDVGEDEPYNLAQANNKKNKQEKQQQHYYYTAKLYRSICCDPNPNGPGIVEFDVSNEYLPSSILNQQFQARYQSFTSGSYARSKQPISLLTTMPTTTFHHDSSSSSVASSRSSSNNSIGSDMVNRMKCTFYFYWKKKIKSQQQQQQQQRQTIASWGNNLVICLLPDTNDVALVLLEHQPRQTLSQQQQQTRSHQPSNHRKTRQQHPPNQPQSPQQQQRQTQQPQGAVTNTIIIAKTQRNSIQIKQWYKCSVSLKRDKNIIELIVEACSKSSSRTSGNIDARHGYKNQQQQQQQQRPIFAAQSQQINTRIPSSTLLTFQTIIDTMNNSPFCLNTANTSVITKQKMPIVSIPTMPSEIGSRGGGAGMINTNNNNRNNIHNNSVKEVNITFWFYPTIVPCKNKCQIIASWGDLHIVILPSLNIVALVLDHHHQKESTTTSSSSPSSDDESSKPTTIARTKSIKPNNWYKCSVCIKRDNDDGSNEFNNDSINHRNLKGESPYVVEFIVQPYNNRSLGVGGASSGGSHSITRSATPSTKLSLTQNQQQQQQQQQQKQSSITFQTFIDTIHNSYFSLATNGTFNGKIEEPAIYVNKKLLISWDLSTNMSAWSIPATITKSSPQSPTGVSNQYHNNIDLVLYNKPTRAVKGRKWDGTYHNWVYGRIHYGAIHFHDDDIYDFNWDHDFELPIPFNMPSGIYLIRLRMTVNDDDDNEEDGELDLDDEDKEVSQIMEHKKLQPQVYEDALPIFICPPKIDVERRPKPDPDDPTAADVAVIIPTFTYVIYGNHARPDFQPSWIDHTEEWGAYPYNPALYKNYGLSAYNFHSDNSGICFASHKRPLLNLRPGFNTFGYNTNCSGLRHFPADSHLISWLHKKNIKFHILTDNELHNEGVHAIFSYKTVLTCSHPEYHTKESLDALRDYRDNGSLVYLGGNGGYWRIARHPQDDTLEIRRTEGGVRTWESAPGEYYSAFDGSYGGLWRRNNRPPQQLFGVGFASQGSFTGMPYKRVCFDSRFDWVFDGIDTNILGDFGFSGGGAAGFELDRVDPRLDGGLDIVILAQSFPKDQKKFILVPEEVLTQFTNVSNESEDEAKRADMVFAETPNGGRVFSVGSITFCGSLPWNDYDNNISTILYNVIQKFTSAGGSIN